MKVVSVTTLTLFGLTGAFQTAPITPLRSITSTSSRSRSIQAAQTGDEFRGSSMGAGGGPPDPRDYSRQASAVEANRVRQAYMDWCRAYDKTFDEERLPIFAENFLRMERYAQQTGERVRFNEFADLTTEEYRYMLLRRQQQQQQSQARVPDWQQAAPTQWQQKVQDVAPKGYETLLGLLVYAQTAVVGAIIGTLFVLPVTAFDYLVFRDFTYTTYAQWEWDLIASAIQAAMFSTVYRYAVRRDIDNAALTTRLIAAFVLVKSLIRITVTPDCAAYSWLYCAEPTIFSRANRAARFITKTLSKIPSRIFTQLLRSFAARSLPLRPFLTMVIDPSRVTGVPPARSSSNAMADDEATTVASGGSEKNERKMMEICVNWCFERVTDRTKAKKLHADMLMTIMQHFHEDIVILDQTNRELVAAETTVETILASKFQFHAAPSARERELERWYCVHKLVSRVSLSTIKQHYAVFQAIKSAGAYVNAHHFAPEIWDIAHIGFLQGYNVKHMHRHTAKLQLQADLASFTNDIPTFEVVTARIKSGQKSHAFHQTSAYEIQCARSDAKQLAKLLKSGPFRKTMPFVPYAYKRRQPDAFLKAIQRQNRTLATTWVIKIEGLTEEAMQELWPAIKDRPGVMHVIPSFHRQDRGEWKVLVEERHFYKTRTWLGAHWTYLMTLLGPHALASIPDTHPVAAIISAATGDDAEDGDEDSYATAFTNAMSVVTVESDQDLGEGEMFGPSITEAYSTSHPPSVHRTNNSPSPASTVTLETPRSYRSVAGRSSSGSGGRYGGRHGGHSSSSSVEHNALLQSLAASNAARDQDRQEFQAQLTAITAANQAQVAALTATIQAQTAQTERMHLMVQQMLQIQQTNLELNPSTPKRSKTTEPDEAELTSSVAGHADQPMQE